MALSFLSFVAGFIVAVGLAADTVVGGKFGVATVIVNIVLVLVFLLPFTFHNGVRNVMGSRNGGVLGNRFSFDDLSVDLFHGFPGTSIALGSF